MNLFPVFFSMYGGGSVNDLISLYVTFNFCFVLTWLIYLIVWCVTKPGLSLRQYLFHNIGDEGPIATGMATMFFWTTNVLAAAIVIGIYVHNHILHFN